MSLHRQKNQLKKAVKDLYLTDEPGVHIYVSLLQTCINTKALAEGKRIHSHMLKTGFEPGLFLETKLLIMYVKVVVCSMHATCLTKCMKET